MTLPDCFDPTDDAALPLHVVAAEAYAGWIAQQPDPVRTWLAAQGSDGSAGGAFAWPSADGALAGALLLVGDRDDPFAYAHAPRALPTAIWRPLMDGDAEPLHLGWGLGSYRFARYKAQKRAARLAAAPLPETLDLLTACVLVRDLVNTPTQDMGPAELEAQARALADALGARFEVIAGDSLLEANYPAIHAVGRASHRPPRLIELHWGDPAHPHVVLCGKGVCFDTGGLDMKAAAGMRNMKKDMGGAAHALALAGLVMARRLPLRITLLIAAVENAVGPDAFRPGEVLATRKGVSIEVDNTDAEGRLVLADALARASELAPDLVLDFATLTGAARIALGPDLPALYSNDDALAEAWRAAGDQCRDPLWRMPLWRPYLRYLTSPIADIANACNSTMAGSVTAALFLERFVGDGLRWAHLDVYAWNDSDRPGRPAGGEAQGLRAAYRMLREWQC